jgi:hypothetical protein
MVVDLANTGFACVQDAMQAWRVAPSDVHVVALVGSGAPLSRQDVVAGARRLGIPVGNVSCVHRHGCGKSVAVEADDGLTATMLLLQSRRHEELVLLTVDQDASRKPGEPPTIIGAVEQLLRERCCLLRVAHVSAFGGAWFDLLAHHGDCLELVDLRTRQAARDRRLRRRLERPHEDSRGLGAALTTEAWDLEACGDVDGTVHDDHHDHHHHHRSQGAVAAHAPLRSRSGA